MAIGANEVDVLLIVEGGLVTVERAALSGSRRVRGVGLGQRGEGAGGLLIRPLGLD